MMKAHGFRLALASLAMVAVAAFHSSAARGDFVTFQNGSGGTTAQINSIVDASGNTLSVGSDTASLNSNLNTYYQAQVANLYGVNGSGQKVAEFAGQLNSTFFLTVMFGVTEQVTAVGTNSNGTNTLTESLATKANQTANYFNIYAQTSLTANDATGTGFNSGTLILGGVITQLGSSFTADANNNNPVLFNNGAGSGGSTGPTSGNSVGQPPLAGSSANQPGSGSFTLTIQVTSADANWFPNAISNSYITFVIPSGNLNDQFSNVTPASSFNLLQGPTTGAYTPNLGNTNGLTSLNSGTGKDFQFQTDASAGFLVQPVPEPASFMLFALGGLPFLGISIRRRLARKANK